MTTTLINPTTGQRSSELVFSLANYEKVFTDPGFQKVLLNTVWWVVLVPVLATGSVSRCSSQG